jgi:hypothetical protein
MGRISTPVQRDAGVEPRGQGVDEDQHKDGRLGRGVDAGVDDGEVHAEQPGGYRRAHQLAAQQHAQDDGGNGQAFDPAIGLDQLRRRQQLGEDAVLGR